MMTLALTTLAVALAALLVGRSILPLFLARDGAAPASPLALEFLLGNVLISIAGLLLAETGYFSLIRLVVVLGASCALAFGIRFLAVRPVATPAYGRNDLIGVALVLAAYLWAFPPLDTALFASDSSLYVTQGVHIAERGSLILHDPTIAPLSPAERAHWFPPYRPGTVTPPFLRVGGGLLLAGLEGDRVVPAFQPLLSVWSAVFYALGGDDALAGPITYFGALFIWTFAGFVVDLAGGWTAAVALGLLTSLVPQYWYSRFLMPEIPSQYFLWSGLWTAVLSSALPATRLGALAGLAIGVAGLMRLDMLIHAAAGLLLWRAVVPWQRHVAGRGFVPALGLVAAYAAAHQIVFPTHYAAEIMPRVQVVLDSLARLHLLDARLGAVAVLVLAAAIVAVAYQSSIARARVVRGAMRIGAALVFALYVFAIVATARPDFATNLRWLELYAGWPLFAVGLVGVWFWWRDARHPAERFVLLLAVVAVAQLFFYPPVSPQPLWAIRRMLRIALPFIAIAAALALTRLAGRRLPVLAAVLAVPLMAFGPRLAFDYRDPAYEHTMTHVRTIGALLPRGSVILGDAAFLAESQLHIALWMTRDTPAYFVNAIDVGALGELRTAIRDRPIFWIGPPGRVPLSSAGMRVVPVATYAFNVATRRMEPHDARDDLGLRAIRVAVYRVELV